MSYTFFSLWGKGFLASYDYYHEVSLYFTLKKGTFETNWMCQLFKSRLFFKNMHCKSWRSSQVQLKHKTQLRGKVISSPIWLVPLVKVSYYCKVRCLISNFEPEGDMGLWGLSLVTCGSFLCLEGLALLFCRPCSLEGMPLVNVVTFHIEWHHFHHTPLISGH